MLRNVMQWHQGMICKKAREEEEQLEERGGGVRGGCGSSGGERLAPAGRLGLGRHQ